jgi:hypothetical protein
MAHYMFAAVCLFNSVEQFTELFGIIATMEWGATSPSIKVNNLHNSKMPHFKFKSILYPQHRSVVITTETWHIVLCSPHSAKIPNFNLHS